MECLLGADDTFGPAINGCRDNFDFTLLFEQSFFQIAPCALLLLLVPVRASYLSKQNVKTLRTSMASIKQASIAVLACTQLALLIVWSLTPMYRTRASIPAATLSFVASLSLLFLSSMEHSRSIRPSAIINTYMLFSLLFDIPQARTLWLRPGPKSLPGVFTAGLAAKSVSLLVEARSKRRSLFPAYRVYAPESLVSLYDRTVLWWLNPLFQRGFSGLISFESLYPVESALASETLNEEFEPVWARYKGKSKHCLLWALISHCKVAMVSFMVPRLVLSAFKLSQPLLINRVTGLMSEQVAGNNTNAGRALIGAAALIYCGLAIANVLYKRQLQRFLARLRGSLVTALYAKILVTPYDKLSDCAAITLINTDVQRITTSLQMIDDIFATPIEIVVAMFLLNRQIGVSCVAPIVLSVSISAISFFNSTAGIKYQKKWLVAVSDRIAYTSSVLNCPKGFKMMGLTEHLIHRVQGLRVKELDDYAKYRKFATYRNVFSNIPDTFAPSITIMMYTLINGSSALNPTRAFTTLGLVALLTGPVGQLIHAVPMFQAALACFDRIQEFLELDEMHTALGRPESASSSGNTRSEDGAIELSTILPKPTAHPQAIILELVAASVRLGKDRKLVLNSIDLKLLPKSLILVVGPVGSGKSTLLRTIIGDVDLSDGHRTANPANGGFAYSAQDPWLPNDTVENLVMGHCEPDDLWFKTVATACALHIDIASFPHGSQTIIGTKGLSLSGGQRQRLALARAVYARKPVVVIDDALSGLDATTSQNVFEALFGRNGLCKTHGMTIVLATHAAQYLNQADSIIALSADGSVCEQGSYDELDRLQGYVHALKSKSDSASASGSEEHIVPVEIQSSAAAAKVADQQHDLARRTGDMTVYKYYAKSIGWVYGIYLVITTILFTFGLKFGDVWVRWWSDESFHPRFNLPLGAWIGIYIILAAVAVFNVGFQIWAFLVWTVPKSSGKLHELLLHAVMRAPYSFFVKTDAGVTLNRFSNDMTLIELDLAGAVMQTLTYGALAVASGALIAAGSKYAAIMMPAVIAVLYFLQKFYLRTSRQMRFMNLEAQAPLMTHCRETLSGSTTIRAFGWQHQSHAKCLTLLDDSQRAYYLMLCIQRWLNLVLDLLTAGVACLVVALAMELRGTSSSGSIGVALVNVLGFNQTLTGLITAWTQMETALGAVARIKNFEADTISENLPSENKTPPPSWPSSGALTLTNVRASYTAAGPDVLKDITLTFPAGSKIGICGRSGSGKSSLLLTLLRLLDTSSGTTTLDGVDLTSIPRQLLRERITALPQEALTLPDSIRSNLDPLSTLADAAIEAALEKVELLTIVNAAGGLGILMEDLALSHGQAQLFAVARALLRPSKLLILDEMTSSVDSVTEAKMMDVVHDIFNESTIIAVAHRLKTIVGYNLVVVMDAGRVVEVGKPSELLEKEGGWFRALYERNGH